MDRLTEWKAPTGRILTTGRTFKVRAPGRRAGSGRWRFLAYVEHPRHPYVEAVRPTGKVGEAVRCFAPEVVYRVSAR